MTIVIQCAPRVNQTAPMHIDNPDGGVYAKHRPVIDDECLEGIGKHHASPREDLAQRG